MKPTNETLDRILGDIAKEHCFVETLEPRRSDSLDFHEVSVWGLKAALAAAYRAGQMAGQRISGIILSNDGRALPALLDLIGLPLAPDTFRHDGNFVFIGNTRDGRQITITTEPADPKDEEYRHIRVTDIAVG